MKRYTMESLLAVQKLQQETEKAQESGNPVKLAEFEQSKEKTAIKDLKEDTGSSDLGAIDDSSDASSEDDFPTLEDYTSWTGYQQELGNAQKFIETPPTRVDYNDLSGLDLIGIEQGFGQYDHIGEHTKYLFSKMGQMLSNALYIATQSKQEFSDKADKEIGVLQQQAERLKAIVSTGSDKEVLVTSKMALQALSINKRYDPANVRIFNNLYTKLFNTFSMRLSEEQDKFTSFSQSPGNVFDFLKVDGKSFNMSAFEYSEDNRVNYFFSEDTVGDIRFSLVAPNTQGDSILAVLENFKKASFSYGYPKSMFTSDVYVTAYDLLELINSSVKLAVQIKAMSQELNKAIYTDGVVSYLVKQLFLDIGPQSEFEARRDELVLTYFLKLSWMFGVLFSAQITLTRVAQNVLEHATTLVTQETSKFF